MKLLILTALAVALCACGSDESAGESAAADANDATELRDWAKSHTSRAELTARLAEAKMALRLVEQTDPGSSDADKLNAEIERLEKELESLADSTRR